MVDFRINWTLQIGLSRFSGSQPVGLETALTKHGGESVYLFFEFTIVFGPPLV